MEILNIMLYNNITRQIDQILKEYTDPTHAGLAAGGLAAGAGAAYYSMKMKQLQNKMAQCNQLPPAQQPQCRQKIQNEIENLRKQKSNIAMGAAATGLGAGLAMSRYNQNNNIQPPQQPQASQQHQTQQAPTNPQAQPQQVQPNQQPVQQQAPQQQTQQTQQPVNQTPQPQQQPVQHQQQQAAPTNPIEQAEQINANRQHFNANNQARIDHGQQPVQPVTKDTHTPVETQPWQNNNNTPTNPETPLEPNYDNTAPVANQHPAPSVLDQLADQANSQPGAF